MREHNIVYNYRFLSDWFHENRKITRKEVMYNMEMFDYKSFRNWIEGNTMLPLTQLMKFCNRYTVPVTAFFLDENADENSILAPITPNSMIEPAGGWPTQERRTGIKVCDPRSKTHVISELPEYVRIERGQKNSIQVTDGQSKSKVTDEERMRYIDIIDKLSSRISELVQENNALHNKYDSLSKTKNNDDSAEQEKS